METATDSCGRVTRALRKRIGSIDSDSSSRPGTPVQSKLAASTNSPLKPRMARRNSTSGVGTPVKTPGKRVGVIASIAEDEDKINASPAKRVTRRRSVSSSTEVEGGTIQPLGLKTPHFDTLTEENDAGRVTRSKSKSPILAKTGKQTETSAAAKGKRKSLRNVSLVKVDNDEIQKADEKNESKKKDVDNTSITKTKSPQKDKSESNKKTKNEETREDKDEQSPKRKSLQKDANLSNKVVATNKEIAEEEDEHSPKKTSPQKETDLSNKVAINKEKGEDKNEPSPKKKSPEKETDLPNKATGEEKDDHSPKKKSPEKDSHIADNEETHEDKDDNSPKKKSPRKEKDSLNEIAENTEKANQEKVLDSIIQQQSPQNGKLDSKDANDNDVVRVTALKPEVCVTESHASDVGQLAVTIVKVTKQHIIIKNEIIEELSEVAADVTEPSVETPSSRRHSVESLHTEAVASSANLDINDEAMDSSSAVTSKETNEMICKTPSPSPSPSKPKSSLKIQEIDPDNVTPAKGSVGSARKAVGFNSQQSDDECERSIYPKTPGYSKSKSFIDMDTSFQGECDDSVVSVDDTSDMEQPETQEDDEVEIITGSAIEQHDDGPGDDNDVELIEESTSNQKDGVHNEADVKTEKEEAVEMKKPKDSPGSPERALNNEDDEPQSPDKLEEKSKEETETDEGRTSNSPKNRKESESLQNHNDSSSPAESMMELKWCNPSVKAKGTKLDTIVIEKEMSDKETEGEERPKSTEKPKRKKKHFMKRAEWNTDEESLNEDEELEEEEDTEIASGEEEEPSYRRKHSFHDDEAMAVDDYESGDSMDSEERQEILENDIPVDGESIGSHTTDGEDDEDEESDNNDSFIVSDNEDGDENQVEIVCSSDSDDEDEEVEEVQCNKREKKKSYKRIQLVNDSSSSSDENQEENVVYEKTMGNKELNESSENDEDDKAEEEEVEEKNALNSTKLSDSAARLQNGEDCGESNHSNEEHDVNKSRHEILRKLNQSDRFNKSVRDLNPDVDASPEVDAAGDRETQGGRASNDDSESFVPSATEEKPQESMAKLNVSISDKKGDENKISILKSDDVERELEDEEGDGSASEMCAGKTRSVSKQSESLVEDKPVTSEEEEEEEDEDEEVVADDGDDDDSDDHDKENESRQQISKPKPKHNKGLSVSFGQVKSRKQDSLQKRVLQRSFTIGVRISGGEVGTAVIENKPPDVTDETSPPPSSSSSANEDTDDAILSSEDIRFLENSKHIPLGNPLVRTRRQSLALPTNPDMEICTSPQGLTAPAKKLKRKSLGILSGNEFNPSQSFVDSLVLCKAEFDRQTSKRKRLSKSFCGTSEGLDSSIIDLDARHLHKRSKLAIDSSFVDSLENLSTNKPICSKGKHSSTPHEKVTKKNDTSIRRILNRCDEILEAANHAKLEAKINYKKSKVKLPKKSKKKLLPRKSLSPESKRDKLFAPLTKEFKRKDKLKRTAAVARALKASADIIIGKQRESDDQQAENSKHLPTNILESLAESESVKTKKTKKNPLAEQVKCRRNYATSAGIVVETLRTPEKKKKKPKVIQLPTGKVCVEPITPITRSVLTCNGMEFHESPATPCGLGFSIKFSALDTPQFAHGKDKDRKRKRNSVEEAKKKTFPKPQWTQSGLFVEEEMPLSRAASQLRILKKHQGGVQNSNANFKQSALLRGDIKRSSTREILQLRERRSAQNNY